MRVESSFEFPTISTVNSVDQRPHQSIFYDNQSKVLEQEDKLDEQTLMEMRRNLPELSSMRCHKTFNNRLKNDFDNLGSLVTGATKDIKEMSRQILFMTKYGQDLNGIRKDVEFE